MTDPEAASPLLRTMRRVRSVRSFRPDPVPDEFLMEILDVARWTGSGANRQPWTFLGDWRGETLGRMRQLIHEADPDVVEERKWVKASNPGTPIWSHDGMICTGETYNDVVKLTFFKGAALKDPAHIFNSSLDGNARRAIDIHEGEVVDAEAFKALIREAVALNRPAK